MEAKSELKYIFANVNEWLKFAEAKHAGLIVLNSGLAIGILSSYSDVKPFIYKIPVVIGIIAFGISVFISIASQFPQTQNIFYNNKEVTNANAYFYGHLAFMDINQFTNVLQKADNTFTANQLDKDLMNQILINARITASKFTFFKGASYLTAFGTGMIGIGSVIKVLCHF